MAAPPIPSPALVLFDIDGTLVRRAGPHHRDALVEAVRAVTGLDSTTDGIPVHGMLDTDILTAMLRQAGAPEPLIGGSMPALLEAAQIHYLRGGPPLEHAICPGVPGFLAGLQERGVPLGIVSGNLERIGWEKLRRAGLAGYFRFGAFAGMGATRGELVGLAIRLARSQGYIDGIASISLVGDSPNDIRAARENQVRAIAVATGISTREELSALAPDLLVEDLGGLALETLLDC